MTSKLKLLNTLSQLRTVFRDFGRPAHPLTNLELSEKIDASERESLTQLMRHCCENRNGDPSTQATAIQLKQIYLALTEEGKRHYLEVMTNNFSIDSEQFNDTLSRYQQTDDDHQSKRLRSQLYQQLQSPRKELIRRLNGQPGGLGFIIQLRTDLRDFNQAEGQRFNELDEDLKELLAGWFDLGLLQLKPLSWNTSANLLEQLFFADQVHPLRNWRNLKRRLDQDRRVFALYHPSMPDEPLIFVQIALVKGLATHIKPILSRTSNVLHPSDADTAIFYSINNTHSGLAGIPFGNALIKNSLSSLRQEFPHLSAFATLSPLPEFRHWLDRTLKPNSRALVSAEEWQWLIEQNPQHPDKPLSHLLNKTRWYEQLPQAGRLQQLLERLCCHYLIHEKRRGHQALDPVAHFHLSNGARIEQINWLANTSVRGLAESAGLMVNYLYDAKAVDQNSKQYRANGHIAISPSIATQYTRSTTLHQHH